MLFRNSNLRRAIGLLGALLALLPCLQQSHSICFFAGCGSTASAAENRGGPSRNNLSRNNLSGSLFGTCSCCSQTSIKNNWPETAPSSIAVRCDNRPNDSCPCPSTCWCHQGPSPWGLPPTMASVPLDLLSKCNGLFQAPMATLSECDNSLSLHQTLNREAWMSISAESASQRCAKLNRFLI